MHINIFYKICFSSSLIGLREHLTKRGFFHIDQNSRFFDEASEFAKYVLIDHISLKHRRRRLFVLLQPGDEKYISIRHKISNLSMISESAGLARLRKT